MKKDVGVTTKEVVSYNDELHFKFDINGVISNVFINCHNKRFQKAVFDPDDYPFGITPQYAYSHRIGISGWVLFRSFYRKFKDEKNFNKLVYDAAQFITDKLREMGIIDSDGEDLCDPIKH